MDTLIQGYSNSTNRFTLHPDSISSPSNPNRENGYNLDHSYTHLPIPSAGSPSIDSSPSQGVSSEGEFSEERDYSDVVLKYINQMLMEEEDLENKPCMFHDCSALQATEKSFYEVIEQKYPAFPNHYIRASPDDDFTRTFSNQSESSSTAMKHLVESYWVHDQGEFEPPPFIGSQVLDSSKKSQFVSQSSGNYVNYGGETIEETSKLRDHSRNGFGGKKNHYREDGDFVGPSYKQLARYAEEESEQLRVYDKVLLSVILNPNLHDESMLNNNNSQKNGQIAGRSRGKKKGNQKEMVDLRNLLMQCAQAVANTDIRAADELLMRIRQHSSAYGDGTERLAHYFANALEARLAGTGTALYTAFSIGRTSTADILKAYQVYVTACPFSKMLDIFANKSINKLARGAARLHIIDFGILYGFQWPCIIQRLSVRFGGPPKLRITGIDFPQPGFRPAERVEETGCRLANYCERFNVPFEYRAIAKKWDTIKLEDLEIDRDELLVVNCLCRLEHVADETLVSSNPRDAILNLIRRINPEMFIHGVVNGTYNVPFFVTRFREALFHFSTLFDMFEATVPCEDHDRLMYEKETFGRKAMNVIACEGSSRIDRPETYKQWQVRNVRAGFRQLPLNQDIVKEIRSKVKLRYHKDFVVDEDGEWMLQGWKGRVTYAISCWKPIQD